jgi:hypothetical protein
MTAQTQTLTAADTETLTGAEIVVRALVDQGVEVLFGYPGGAVLPLYDALFNEPRLQSGTSRGRPMPPRATPAPRESPGSCW